MMISIRDARCVHCKTLMLKQAIQKGMYEIKCRKCATINRVECDNGKVTIIEVSAVVAEVGYVVLK